MKLVLGAISSRRSAAKSAAAETLLREFVARSARLCPTESSFFRDEEDFLRAAERQPGRVAAVVILCDSRGEDLTSGEFAAYLGRLRDEGAQRLLLGIGPADGWSALARAKAAKVVSFGRMTLPHELARVVLAEQVYRALTILAGHPYHCGH